MTPSIQILVDNNSWILPYANTLLQNCIDQKIECELIRQSSDISEGDILFLLGCTHILPEHLLSLHTYNLVVHESALPQGKGWSPLTWQILEGKNSIPITLFEAQKDVDSGQIYFQDTLAFNGHELIDELRQAQGQKTIELCQKFISSFPNIKGTEQTGNATFYNRRTPQDSELDITKSLESQFNLLRTVDNEKYPAYFSHKGHIYTLKIERKNT
jgi:methionyl-tRNA formyltransferase